jgi:LEA14-like dessication related protein
VLGAALAMLTGCASLSMKSPEVSLSSVEIQEFALLEQRLGLKLRVINPNDKVLQIDGVSFEVEVNGQPFAKGVSNKAVTVPRLGEAVLDLSAVTTLNSVLKQLGDLARNGRDSVEYRVHGQFHGGGLNGVPFDSKRELRMPKWLTPPAPDNPSPKASVGAA